MKLLTLLWLALIVLLPALSRHIGKRRYKYYLGARYGKSTNWLCDSANKVLGLSASRLFREAIGKWEAK